MSDAPKKRPLFQIHLSTCIVLMFVAGGVIWANVRTWEIPLDSAGRARCFARGWPGAFMREYVDYDSSLVTVIRRSGPLFSTEGVVVNSVCAVLILATTAFICECLIRRRERRHE